MNSDHSGGTGLETPSRRGGTKPVLNGPSLGDPFARRVAEVLGATELLTPEKVARVKARIAESGGSVARALVEEGVATSDSIARTLAGRHQLPLIDLQDDPPSPDAVRHIPVHVLQRVVAIPHRLEENALLVAVADPGNIHGIDELRLATRYHVEFAVASQEDIIQELKRFARQAEAMDTVQLDDVYVVAEGDDDDDLDEEDGVSDAPLVRLVNSIIFQAAEDGASDVHFEPMEDVLVVRSRIDGVLQEMHRISKRMAPGVTSRLKVLAKLDIAERRKPQDGRISLNAAAAGRMLDVRVATLPTVEGESVVMRLLDKSRRPPTLEELGLSDFMRERLSRIVQKPTGAVLVTGPTGSGKSTTLYGALALVNDPAIKIITVEDPVEYRLTGVNQVQINLRAGLTFATALRSILRSDPDIVMVGEIRDVETAKISIEAALTGHFVLSSLHTNDAPGALTRLNEMGVEPFLTGAAVTAVLAQRLARKLCVHCREEYAPTEEEIVRGHVHEELAGRPGLTFFRKVGCNRCGQTGYRGRTGVFQMLEMGEGLETLASQKASRDEIEREAIRSGMRSLWDDGLEKVAQGITSLEELGRVLTT
jgi:type IV pilus assembly protein PilB